MMVQVAQIVAMTEAEGPGRRFALWFQGCPLRCAGCCNPEMLPFAGGREIQLAEIVDMVRAAAQKGVEGITLLGGEPTSHALAAGCLAREVRKLGLSVMVFSGFTLEELRCRPDETVHELLVQTDILVDGPYRADLPDTRRRWIGSTNQRIHFLTDRYAADDPCWQRPNTLEIRLEGNNLSVNGFPAGSAVGLWQPFHKFSPKRASSSASSEGSK